MKSSFIYVSVDLPSQIPCDMISNPKEGRDLENSDFEPGICPATSLANAWFAQGSFSPSRGTYHFKKKNSIPTINWTNR